MIRFALTVVGGRCQTASDGTLGVNVGPNAALPALAVGAALARP